MNFLVVTHVIHKKIGDSYWAYGPYVREMNLWFKHVDKVTVLAPLNEGVTLPDSIDLAYLHPNIQFIKTKTLLTIGIGNMLESMIVIPGITAKIFRAMAQADHIHLRCPGNLGLLGCLIQPFFANKPKSAKYAGNWDWNSKQPQSYRLQQKILRNRNMTKNMKVLTYGDWESGNDNLLPFFTATYSETEIMPIKIRSLQTDEEVRLIFVGTMNGGKNPLLSVQVAERLKKEGVLVRLDIFGEGFEKAILASYISEHNLSRQVILHGNKPSHDIKKAFQQSHFLVFASRSEGWPKVVAEAMFWGCLPLTTAVSCVPEMVGYGERGDLIDENVQMIVNLINGYRHNEPVYQEKANAAMNWSREYTLERFESEIKKVLDL
ncbi:glycosyltransferase [Algoriphagus sp.]|uniref:glycosyltransferase n=1 Tax=Algoriphagus sp. TaxID=1872435 RepID=UPI003F72F3A8